MNTNQSLKEINSPKIEVLDSLRAFAALSVCIFHFICITGYIHTKWILDFFYHWQFGVQLFFVISGFVIPWSMYHANFKLKHFFKFAFKRFCRLEPPYLASLLLAIFILWGRDYFLHTNNFSNLVSLKRVALHFGYLIPLFENYKWLNDVYWTLAAEFQYYFLIALLFIPLIKSNFFLRVVIGGCMIGFSFIGGPREFLPYWLPVFYIGILIFLFKIQKIAKIEFYITVSVLFLFSCYHYHLGSVVYMLIAAVAILYYGECKVLILNYLGKMSYSIYLVHLPIGLTLMNIMAHSFFDTYLEKVFVLLSGFVATLISSYIMYLLVERPSKKLSASIKYKK